MPTVRLCLQIIGRTIPETTWSPSYDPSTKKVYTDGGLINSTVLNSIYSINIINNLELNSCYLDDLVNIINTFNGKAAQPTTLLDTYR